MDLDSDGEKLQLSAKVMSLLTKDRKKEMQSSSCLFLRFFPSPPF